MPALGTKTPATEVSSHWKTGVVKLRSVESANTAEWLLCDGSFKSQASYPALYGKVGHTHNRNAGGTPVDPGDGTFRLPDLRQAIPRGIPDTGTAQLGTRSGVIDHTHGVSSMGLADHTHVASAYSTSLHGHSSSVSFGDHRHDVVIQTYQPKFTAPSDALFNLYNFGYTFVDYIAGQGITIPVNNLAAFAVGGNTGGNYAPNGFTGASAAANPPFQTVAFFIST